MPWRGKAYVTAGEATGAWVRPGARGEGRTKKADGSQRKGSGHDRELYPEPESQCAEARTETDPEAAGTLSENALRSARRARATVRRYAVHNSLVYFWSFTCADQTHDFRILRRRCQRFFRKLRQEEGPLPYLYVFEEHKSGALHAHAMVDRYLQHPDVAAMWGHGWVYVRDKRRHVKRLGFTGTPEAQTRAAARLAASYTAKYVMKAYEAGVGRHGYEIGQGFKPIPVEVSAASAGELLARLREAMGGDPPEVQWDSDTEPDWTGPRAFWGRWA